MRGPAETWRVRCGAVAWLKGDDGRIQEFKEYLDTEHAREVLVDAAP